MFRSVPVLENRWRRMADVPDSCCTSYMLLEMPLIIVWETYRWSREVQSSPFGTVSDLGEELLFPPLDFPRLQTFAIGELFLVKLPHNLVCAVAAHPLTVQIQIDIDVEFAINLNSQI